MDRKMRDRTPDLNQITMVMKRKRNLKRNLMMKQNQNKNLRLNIFRQ